MRPTSGEEHPVTADDLPEIGVGMLGYAFMGKAHSNAFRKLGYIMWPPPLRPRLVAIAGRNEEAVAEAASRYGFERWTTQWQDLVADPEIGLVDNLGPNDMHAVPTIAAAEAGKHVVCEKPLGRDADESYEIWRRVATTGVKHMCAFNYRFVPAVRLAREMIDAGELGELRHFRGRYLQDWGETTEQVWRFDRTAAGSGALGDLGAHVVDLARYLVGEIETVGGFVRTFIPKREVDDAVEATVEFQNGAVGTIEATRLALGRRNACQWEINGSRGSLFFDMERLNELHVFRADGDRHGASRACSSRSPITRSRSTGGRRATSSAGETRSSTSCTTSWPRSPETPTWHRTGRPSRTGTARPRSAAPSSARAKAADVKRLPTGHPEPSPRLE